MTLADEAAVGGFATDIGVLHHFAGGVYAKQMHLPAGYYAVSHAHEYDHLSILASGVADVQTDTGITRYLAPAVVAMPARVHHRIVAIEDVTWFCIHKTDITDPEKVDDVLTAKVA